MPTAGSIVDRSVESIGTESNLCTNLIIGMRRVDCLVDGTGGVLFSLSVGKWEVRVKSWRWDRKESNEVRLDLARHRTMRSVLEPTTRDTLVEEIHGRLSFCPSTSILSLPQPVSPIHRSVLNPLIFSSSHLSSRLLLRRLLFPLSRLFLFYPSVSVLMSSAGVSENVFFPHCD